MKHLMRLSLAIAFVMAFAGAAFGVPAYPGELSWKQSDGTTLTYRLHGDEFLSWGKTLDGYTIMRDAKGDYVYMDLDAKGDLQPTEMIAHNQGERSLAEEHFLRALQPGLFFSRSQTELVEQIVNIHQQERGINAFPTTGDRKLICILMEFPERQMVKSQADFDALFNTVGYNQNGEAGSVKDYYLQNSYQQFNLTVDVAGPYESNYGMSYYGGEDGFPQALAREAVMKANADVNFTDYDNDNDGTVDGIYVIYAGYDRSAGGPANSIWAHASNIYPTTTVDGVLAQRYSCSSELRGTSGSNLTHIGVICHEFGHVLGAMDYYDTNYETGGEYEGTGEWDMMASGSWNNNGACPPHHNAYTKTVVYHWAEQTVLSSPASLTLLPQSVDDNSFYRFNTSTNNEYYLLEVRHKSGFDAYVPGSGLMIYHVHSSVGSAGNNINSTHPQRMYPVCASATVNPTSTPSSYGAINSTGCAWPYGSKNEFTDNSTPWARSWAGQPSGKPITGIMRNSADNSVSFDFMGGAGNPSTFDAAAVSGNAIELTWTQTTVENMLVAWSPTGIFGQPADGTAYSVGDAIQGGGQIIYTGTDTSFTHSGLQPATQCYYKIWAITNAAPDYTSGKTAQASTQCGTVDRFPYTETFGTRELPACMQNIDNNGGGQVWRFNNPQNRPFASTTAANGIAILDSENFGNGNTQDADLVSPAFSFAEYQSVELSFEHFYSHRNSTATVLYSVDGGATYTPIQEYTATTGSFNTPAVATFDLSDQLAGQADVRFKWSYAGTYGIYWCIDDITVDAADRRAIEIASSGVAIANGGKLVDYNVTSQGSAATYQIAVQSVGDLPVTITAPVSSNPRYSCGAPSATTIQPGQAANFTVTFNSNSSAVDSTVITIGNNTPINDPFVFTVKSNVATQFAATFVVDNGATPLQGATVALEGYGQQTTNASGAASFTGVAAGTDIPFTVSKTDHHTYNGTLRLIDANQTVPVTIPLTDLQISFQLINSVGAPVTNSRVTVDGYGQQTTSGGITTFALPAFTDFTYTCSATNYANSTGEFTTGAEAETIVVIMERTTYTVNVTVRSGATLVQNAQVTIADLAPVATGADGVASVAGVLPGMNIPLTVTAAGYFDHTETISVTGNKNVTVQLSVGIDEPAAQLAAIYPNPTSGALSIAGNQGYNSYKVVDASGRTLAAGALQPGDNQVDLGQLQAGVYHLVLSGPDATHTVAVVKK